MQTVLIAGAGRSSTWLIDYMLKNARRKWRVIVMDSDSEIIAEKLRGHPKGEAAILDIHNEEMRQDVIKKADLVISLMPPSLHILIAKDCLEFKKNLLTASYISDELSVLHEKVKEAGLLFMCEMGLDPGIDHMSALALFKGIEKISGEITSFKSACGGLVAKESDDNPWRYKISWNSKNMINAGKGGATWLENGKEMHVDYEDLFAYSKKVNINSLGTLAAYPNRDSLSYRDLYNLENAKTFVRLTLRYPAFIKGWSVFVQAGLTDDKDSFNVDEITYADWIAFKTGLENDDQLRINFKNKYSIEDKEMKLFDWLRIFENRPIYLEGVHSSAKILQFILENRWRLNVMDKDMVVMQHQIEYE